MWGNVFITNRFNKEELSEDFQLTDLKEENSELRRQIADLYSKLLNGDKLPMSISAKCSRNASKDLGNYYAKLIISEECKNPTNSDEIISMLETELTNNKIFIKEQANALKDLERKCQQKEEELLNLSLEVIQSIPLKSQIRDLKKTSDEQCRLISQLKAESASLTLQIQTLQEENNSKITTIKGHEDEITKLSDDLSKAESDLEGSI